MKAAESVAKQAEKQRPGTNDRRKGTPQVTLQSHAA